MLIINNKSIVNNVNNNLINNRPQTLQDTDFTCRVCGSKILLDNYILEFKNVPDRSQHLLKVEDLHLETEQHIKVFDCEYCSTVQLSNEPLENYEYVIRASKVSSVVREQKLEQFRNFIDKYNLKGKNIIEFGCGNGDYLGIVNELDINAYGIEYSPENNTVCKNEGLNVEQNFIFNENQSFFNIKFDAFYCFNFLEHIPNPNTYLKGIYNNLNDGAYGIIEVPNYDMMLKEGLYSEFVLDHLVYYTKETLSLVLKKNGFEVVEFLSLRDEYVLNVVVRKKQKQDISLMLSKEKQVKEDIQNFINSYENVAVWGAGHQSFFLLSQINNYDKVKCIFDSADFKQNRVAPATHIPIVKPDFSEKIDAVLVIAGSYSDEIVEILKNDYKFFGVIAKIMPNGVDILNRTK